MVVTTDLDEVVTWVHERTRGTARPVVFIDIETSDICIGLIIELTSDTEAVHFKLRWNDEVRVIRESRSTDK